MAAIRRKSRQCRAANYRQYSGIIVSARPAGTRSIRLQLALQMRWVEHLEESAIVGILAMSITIARLHPRNYDLLKNIDDGCCPEPDRSVVVIARNESRIIGRLFLMAPAHVEGIYIEPEFRGGSLFKDMMAAMEIEARAEGLTKIFAYSIRSEIGHYIEHRCGYLPLPWRVFAKELACPAH
jgi:hypothetical protein